MHFIEAKSLLTRWNGMNVYRGCTHGCIYCDSRSTCYHIDHAFEDVAVKANAPELLDSILARKRSKIMVGTGSMSDPYQPCEQELCLTRRCLEIIEARGHGATVITKSDLVLRDLELLQRINERARAVVQVTLTVADDDLSRLLEPAVCPSSRRFEVLREFQRAGVPTVVWMTPLLPHITDTRENFDQLLNWCFDAGVAGIVCFNAGMSLREGDREYYYAALDRLFPGMSERYRREFGDAYQLASPESAPLMERFHRECERRGIIHVPDEVFRFTASPPPAPEQLALF